MIGLPQAVSVMGWLFLFYVMELLFKGHTIFLDAEDYHYLEEMTFYIWKSPHTYYLLSTVKYKQILFHRLITNPPENKHIDHINGNGFDNRKENLRFCNDSQNHQNRKKLKNTSSKYKGVCWNKDCIKWRSYIKINKRLKHLGVFEREQEAAKAYNYMALKYFGEYAKINEFN